MKRRELLTTIVASGLAAPALAAQDHAHRPMNGPIANATVSFGAWPPANDQTPLAGNRFRTPLALPAPNVHALIPYEATIKAGGTVNFVVAGYHLIAVYEDKTPEQINVNLLANPIITPQPPANPGPPLIDDPSGRVYFGIDPRRVPLAVNMPAPVIPPPPALPPPPPYSQDRVEVVHFPDPGRYLVICAVLPHFVNDQMHGWVNVLP